MSHAHVIGELEMDLQVVKHPIQLHHLPFSATLPTAHQKYSLCVQIPGERAYVVELIPDISGIYHRD
jgi:hypothetical protein